MTNDDQAPPTAHVWKFFRISGLDQVSLETSDDLMALDQLDQKLWVALSCPIKGLELDEKTLAQIDSDKDGRIRVPELIAAVNWAAARLKNPGDLLQGGRALPLDAINDETAEGKALLKLSKEILAQVKKPGASVISVGDNSETAKIITDSALNGDGVIPPEVATDPETRALIEDIIATVGGVPDRNGPTGVDSKKMELFFKELAAYDAWASKGAAVDLSPLGAATSDAHLAVKAVRAKVDDYFARCRLAAFDSRALWAVNRQESEYLAIAAKDLTITATEIAAFPLARVDADKPLPLSGTVNPAWAGALATLKKTAVAPMFGAGKNSLTDEEWSELGAKLAPYEQWLKDKDGVTVEKLGPARARALLAGSGRAALEKLLADDEALAGVDRLARYYRDLPVLLQNFVNFADLYSPTRYAIFQAGTLYLDSRACELCIRVEDPAVHGLLAAMSKAYIAYVDCKRDGQVIKIAACFTQGDSDYLFVGRNGLFYDRQGRDWHATITKIIDNPISIRQAFWSPYKKFVRMLEEQVAKRAAAAETASTSGLETAAAAAVTADAKSIPPKKFDVGTVAALGVGIGAISTFFATVIGKFVEVPAWKIAVAFVALMLLISLPSMVIAWLKLRQRNLGPILEANGWAINGRVKINIPFGTALTERARLPANAKRMLTDPYEDKSGARWRTVAWMVIFIVIAALVAARIFHRWPFPSEAVVYIPPASATTPMVDPASTPAPAPAQK